MRCKMMVLSCSFAGMVGCAMYGASDDDSSSYPPTVPSSGAPPVATTAPTSDSRTPANRPQVAMEQVPVSNPFVLADSDSLSTFAVDVDTASYDIFRRSLESGILPNPTEVRSEEYVNYFHYDYPAPTLKDEVPFSISLAASAHIADVPTKLLRVGIQGAVAEKRPTNLVFLVDVSGSMAAPNKLPLVQRVLREALDVLDPGDKVSIVTYAGSVGVALPPTEVRERARITSALSGLAPSGGTNGSSGIQLAYQQANAAFLEEGINHVVLCTDGDFNLGVTSDEALVSLIEQKRKSGVTLTALGFGERNNDRMMERVSNAGNGIYSVLYNEDQAIAYVHQRLLSSMIHIAKDVKIQVAFNPEHVYAYRLIGYEDRLLLDSQFRDDWVDAGEIGSGHQVTALFELALSAEDLPSSATPSRGEPQVEDSSHAVPPEDLVRVSVRFKRPGAAESEAAREVSQTLGLAALADDVSELDADAVWAMGVASLAELLHHSPHAQKLDVAGLEGLLGARVGDSAERAELHALLPKVQRLMGR
jgi:Ca-activated chloride channel family protein